MSIVAIEYPCGQESNVPRFARLRTLVMASCIWLLTPLSVNAQVLDEARSHLRDATTLYWLGIADKGDPLVFERALRSVAAAEARLRLVPDSLRGEEGAAAAETLALLRNDLMEQKGVARNNHSGRLPLTRFLGPPPFLKSNSFGTYEIAAPPGEVAAARAAGVIGSIVQQGLWGDAQLPMFVFAAEEGPGDAESGLRALLKHHQRVKVYENSYLRSFLSTEEVEAISSGSPSRTVVDKIQEKLGASFTAFTYVELYHTLEDIHFYRFRGQIFDNAAETPAQTILHYEFIRDKRDIWFPALLLSLLLIGTAVAVFHFLKARSHPTRAGPRIQLLVPALAWFGGLAVALTVAAVFSKVRPDYQEYISYSFWWLPILFLLFFGSTAMLVRKGASYFSGPAKGTGQRETEVGIHVGAALGVSTLVGFGLLIYHGNGGWPLVAASSYLFATSGFVAGNILSRVDPRPPSVIIPFVLLLAVGAWVVGGTAITPAWGLIIAVGAAHALFLRNQRHGLGRIKVLQEVDPSSGVAGAPVLSIETLLQRVEDPPYFETLAFKSIAEVGAPLLQGRGGILCLTGEEGVGKTASAEELIRRLRSEADRSGRTLFVLRGVAGEQEGDSRPYLPVRRALSDFFEVSPLDSAETQAQKIDSVLDGVFKKFVPYAGLLLPPQGKTSGAASTQDELFHSITLTLKRLAEKGPTVFFIDDLHWADSATFDLLHYLHTFFAEHPEYPLLFLYTSRPDESGEKLTSGGTQVELQPLGDSETHAFLVRTFALSEESARLIIEWLSDHRGSRGHLFWLLRVLRLLAEDNHLSWEGGRFQLSRTIRSSGQLPIPEEYRLAVRSELDKLSAHRNIIGMAAVIGLRFEAELVADGLKLEHLKCLEALETIEVESGLIYDVPDHDGVFAFRSSFALETVRAEMGIRETASHHARLREIVKEYHALVARVTEGEGPACDLLKAASCYHTAGLRYAERTFTLSVKAADYCMDIFRFDEARRYLEMAEQSIKDAGEDFRRTIDLTFLKMRLTVEEGRSVEVAPEACIRILDSHPDLANEELSRFALYFYHLRRYEVGLAVSERMLFDAADAMNRARGHFWRALCTSSRDLTASVSDLRSALGLLETLDGGGPDQLRLEAQVHNALGEAYTRQAPAEPTCRALAKESFLKSIELKSRPEIFDRVGLARSYGGLGRLALYLEPSDPGEALEYFNKDLELAKVTGDHRGQVKMHSFIGECLLRLGRVKEAAAAYERSRLMSTDPLDNFFALLGLLKLSTRDDVAVDLTTVAPELAELMVSDILPEFCESELRNVLGSHPRATELRALERWTPA